MTVRRAVQPQLHQEACDCRKTPASLAKAASRPSAATSTHCDSLRKYSNAGVSCASSSRTAMIGLRFEEARSSSLPTCEDPLGVMRQEQHQRAALR